jgi:hypothetical protein
MYWNFHFDLRIYVRRFKADSLFGARFYHSPCETEIFGFAHVVLPA